MSKGVRERERGKKRDRNWEKVIPKWTGLEKKSNAVPFFKNNKLRKKKKEREKERKREGEKKRGRGREREGLPWGWMTGHFFSVLSRNVLSRDI